MSSTSLLEFVSAQTGRSKIDRVAGVIHDVKILGLYSRNHRRYPESTLINAAPLYENAKVNLNHPDGSAHDVRKYQDRFGLIKNVRVRQGEGLFGDFHFNPKHALAEQFLWDAENSPENVGFSHNVEAVVANKDGHQIIEKIAAVRSVDLVADPATTCGLFEQHTPINSDTAAANNPSVPNNETDTAGIPDPNGIADAHVETDPGDEATILEPTAPEAEQSAQKIASLTGRVAVLERLLERTLESDNRAEWNKTFAALLLETENPTLAERLIAERAEFVRRLQTPDGFPLGPVRSAAPESIAETDVTTEEFVRTIVHNDQFDF